MGVILIDGVTLTLGVTEGESDINGKIGVLLGVTETEGIGVREIDGVIDKLGVTLGDSGITRTGHSNL